MFLLAIHDEEKSTSSKDDSIPFMFAHEIVTVGRSQDAELTLPERNVSRRHACFRRNAQHLLIEDLNSRGGTFLNGVRLSPSVPSRVRAGDEIRVGDVVLTIMFIASVPLAVPARLIAVEPSTVPAVIVIADAESHSLSIRIPRTDSGCIVTVLDDTACSVSVFGPPAAIAINGTPVVEESVLCADDVLTVGRSLYRLAGVLDATNSPHAENE